MFFNQMMLHDNVFHEAEATLCRIVMGLFKLSFEPSLSYCEVEDCYIWARLCITKSKKHNTNLDYSVSTRVRSKLPDPFGFPHGKCKPIILSLDHVQLLWRNSTMACMSCTKHCNFRIKRCSGDLEAMKTAVFLHISGSSKWPCNSKWHKGIWHLLGFQSHFFWQGSWSRGCTPNETTSKEENQSENKESPLPLFQQASTVACTRRCP